MRKLYLLSATALSVLVLSGPVHAVEIKIIDKTYSEEKILKGRTLQSDLDEAESTGKPYTPQKYTAPAPAHTPKHKPELQKAGEPAYDKDPVYSVDDTENLKGDLDKTENKSPVAEPAAAAPVSAKPAPAPKAAPVSGAIPVPPAMPEQIPSPIRQDEIGTSAPSEREPVLLGKMSDDELKKELGIKGSPAVESETDVIAPPEGDETSVEPQAGDEALSEEDAAPTAPPKEAMPPENFSPSVQ